MSYFHPPTSMSAERIVGNLVRFHRLCLLMEQHAGNSG
jgi:hypothetical protein